MHLRSHLLTAVFTALFLFVGRASAQDLWQPRTSGVTVPLWSVAYGANQWVAVGEQGTILTSPDGVSWTPRTSGFPTRWLVGVGYGTPNGNGLWIVVGENGLILSSPDAITWTPRSTTGTRINAVAYGNGTFVAADDAGITYFSLDGLGWNGFFGGRNTFVRGLAYGAPHFVTTGQSGINTTYDGVTSTVRVASAPQLQAAAYGRRLYLATGGANTFTSRDAITWTQQTPTTTVGVQGATFFNNQFVAVGNAGGITTTFDGSLWSDRTSGTTQTLLAVAASPDSAVAVGFGGTILQSAATPSAPVPTISTSAPTEAVGGNVALTVTTRGSAPFTYQWRKDGADLPGATTDTLFLANVQLTDTGAYSCMVTNSVASVGSSAATVTVVSTFPPADPVDLAFTLGPTLNAPPRTAALQLDGKILIGGAFLILNEGQAQFGLARVTSTGALDTTFKPGAIDPNGVVQTIVVQPDGKILIGGSFTSINGVARNRLARLNTDGSLDATFVTAYNFTNSITKLVLTSDGRVLVAQATTLIRLNLDGSTDSTWTSSATNFGTIQMFDVQQDGRVIVAAVLSAFGGRGTPASYSLNIYRLLGTGLIDSSFAKVDLNPSVPGLKDTFSALSVLPDGRIMVAVTNSGGDPQRVGFLIQRFTSAGLIDPSFASFDNPTLNLGTVAFTSDGRTWIAGAFTNLKGIGRNQLARLNTDGTLDATYSSGTGVLNANGLIAFPAFILPLDDGRAIAGGDFNRINSTVRPYLARLNAQSSGGANAPAVVTLDSYYREVRAGEPIASKVSATGSATLTYTGVSPGFSTTGLATSVIQFPGVPSGAGSVFSVSATNSNGTSAAQFFYVRITPSAPFIVAQPAGFQTNTGRPIALTVTAGGGSGNTYQWFKNGSPIAGATGLSYLSARAATADSGDYTVVIRNSLGFATSQTVHLGVDETSRFVNIATRALAGRPDAPLIAGFIVAGPGSKRVMLRAVGPTLGSSFNLPGFLADPVLTVYNSTGTQVYTNDDWGSANDVPGLASAQTRIGAFPLANGSADAGGILTLQPGSYTAVVTGKAGATGVALVEVYEDDTLSSRLINLSTRAYVGTGASVAIPGIVFNGTTAPKKLLVRAIGPGLSAFGVPAVLADPKLTITNSANATVATNDDWESAANLADLITATAKTTFPLTTGSKDAAVLVTLPAGGYTVQVSGVADTAGNALVEVYELP